MSNLAEAIEPQDISTQIAEFNEFEASLAEYKDKYTDVVYDLTDGKQMKLAKSDKLAIGKTVSALDRRHKEIKAPLQERVSLLDGERKRIKDGLRDIQESIKGQIESHEEAIKAVADELLRRASVPRDYTEFDTPPTIDLVRERLESARAFVVDDSLGEMEAFAALNKMKAIETLEPLLLGLEAQEKAAIEAEEKRVAEVAAAQKERENRIALEAKEMAEAKAAEAERAATQKADDAIDRERKLKLKAVADAVKRVNDAKEKAKRDKAESDQRMRDAAARAEQSQREAVKKAKADAMRKAEKVECVRLAAIEAEKAAQSKREANTKHLAKINNAAALAFVECAGVEPDQAKAIVTAIAKQKIPAVTISY